MKRMQEIKDAETSEWSEFDIERMGYQPKQASTVRK